jgi:hypothetical protein
MLIALHCWRYAACCRFDVDLITYLPDVAACLAVMRLQLDPCGRVFGLDCLKSYGSKDFMAICDGSFRTGKKAANLQSGKPWQAAAIVKCNRL